MAQYGLETETTTHLKGMTVGGGQGDMGGGKWKWYDVSVIDKFYLSDDGYLLCISNLVPDEFCGIAYSKLSGEYYYGSAKPYKEPNFGFFAFETGGYGAPSNLTRVVICKSLEDYRVWEDLDNKASGHYNTYRTFEPWNPAPPFGVWMANIAVLIS